MEGIYDLVIIGAGPAGLSAAIYASRARLNALVIEKEMASGGQVVTTYEVDNYPGLPGINGFDLGQRMQEHAKKLGARFVSDKVTGIEDKGGEKIVVGEKSSYKARTVLIATGAAHRKLEVAGEKELTGMGVSYCATCDGAFFRNRTVAVVGGGDVALEDAIFLSRLCEKVYLIHRRNELRGAKSLQETLLEKKNIEIIWDTVVEEIQGKNTVERLKLRNKRTGDDTILNVQGVFIAIGLMPNSWAFEGTVLLEQGYVTAGEDGKTSVPGIFAAGDVRTKALRQIVTAVSDGANAVTSVEKYLSGC